MSKLFSQRDALEKMPLHKCVQTSRSSEIRLLINRRTAFNFFYNKNAFYRGKKKSHTQYSIFHITVWIPELFLKKYLKYVLSVHLLHEIWNLKKKQKENTKAHNQIISSNIYKKKKNQTVQLCKEKPHANQESKQRLKSVCSERWRINKVCLSYRCMLSDRTIFCVCVWTRNSYLPLKWNKKKSFTRGMFGCIHTKWAAAWTASSVCVCL